MTATSQISADTIGRLPTRMRVVWVSDAAGDGAWLSAALADDRACTVELRHAGTSAAGIARLREGDFDAILIEHSTTLDALEFASACRGGGFDDPLVIVGHRPIIELEAAAYETGADAYLPIGQTSVRALLWSLGRAYERAALIRENRLLRQNEHRRLHWEQVEATRLLSEQRAMLSEITTAPQQSPSCEWMLPAVQRRMRTERVNAGGRTESHPALQDDYRELLRTYVIMGSGNLSAELRSIAERLVSAGIGARQAMLLHLQAVEELVKGLGQRSSRHLLARADLLILELMIEMTDRPRSANAA